MLQSKLLYKTFILVQEFSKSMGKYESYEQFNEKIIDGMEGGHFVYFCGYAKFKNQLQSLVFIVCMFSFDIK